MKSLLRAMPWVVLFINAAVAYGEAVAPNAPQPSCADDPITHLPPKTQFEFSHKTTTDLEYLARSNPDKLVLPMPIGVPTPNASDAEYVEALKKEPNHPEYLDYWSAESRYFQNQRVKYGNGEYTQIDCGFYPSLTDKEFHNPTPALAPETKSWVWPNNTHWTLDKVDTITETIPADTREIFKERRFGKELGPTLTRHRIALRGPGDLKVFIMCSTVEVGMPPFKDNRGLTIGIFQNAFHDKFGPRLRTETSAQACAAIHAGRLNQAIERSSLNQTSEATTSTSKHTKQSRETFEQPHTSKQKGVEAGAAH